MSGMVSALLTEKKAAKWDSLMKWIKDTSEDSDDDRDVDTIWDKLDSLDYQELNSKDVRIEVLDKALEEEVICDDGCTIGCCGLGGECENCMDWIKCEQCGTDNNVEDYWWIEQKKETWKLCEQCGIDEEQEKVVVNNQDIA